MKQIAKFLPRAGQLQPSSDSTSPEATYRAPHWANSAGARLVPASAKEMALALNELLSVYGVPAGWDTGASVYRRLWGHLPGDVLHEAIDRHLSESHWFPKPADILALAADEMGSRLDRRIALPSPPEEPIDRMTAEECDELMAQYRIDRIPVTREPVRALYVVDEVPDTIAGKPWR